MKNDDLILINLILAVHCGSIRQTASILEMSRDCLRTGDKALVRFRFIKHPEYLKRGQRMVTHEHNLYFRQYILCKVKIKKQGPILDK